jgi:DNA-binding XRE family transcriptional regulator
MTNEVAGNYLRTHRRRCGLSQEELAALVGYKNWNAVGRHERSQDIPPFLVALAYEIVFEVPVAQLFPGFYSAVRDSVAQNLRELKGNMAGESGDRRRSNPEKTQWLLKQSVG